MASKTVDFGCPVSTNPHCFVVEIPHGRGQLVTITEYFGDTEEIELKERAVLPREYWQAIAPETKRIFNERLKANKLRPSTWKLGENKLERLLGKELLVLVWTVEKAALEEIPIAIKNWAGLKPEERWWLYTMTAASAGNVGDSHRGWRRALRYALTDGDAVLPAATWKKYSRKAEQSVLPLFDK
ncbi:MAG: DUF3780 domain-containing protein [Gammaproteobacteria bacterium]|nr:DUF3780 domain-containing protein [Gammaproteobacteria bacterium]